jgi:hypothetical protein
MSQLELSDKIASRASGLPRPTRARRSLITPLVLFVYCVLIELEACCSRLAISTHTKGPPICSTTLAVVDVSLRLPALFQCQPNPDDSCA